MLYPITRIPAKILLGTYFRHVHINQVGRIPKGKAVILAANHPTAFIEPCIMACWLDQPLYYVVRGDLFSKKLFAWFLETYHMVAFFRMKDGGYSKIKNNYRSFDRVFNLLAAHKPVMILAEGSTRHEKRLRPLMKGTARMAFGTMEQKDLDDVVIVPVGVNFTAPNETRSEAMISFGDPIHAADFLEEYAANNNKGILELTREVRRRLEPEVLIIEQPEREDVAEFFFEFYRNEHQLPLWPVTVKSDQRLRDHQQISSWIHGLEDAKVEDLRAKISEYKDALKANGQSDIGMANRKKSSPATGLLLAAMVLPAVLGWLLHLPMTSIGRWIVDNKVKSLEFKGSIFIASILGGYLIWLPLYFLFAALAGFWWLPLFVPVLGYFYVIFRDKLKRWQSAWRLRHLATERKEALIEMRADLLAQMPKPVQ
ncbi:MAG: hypothetical protein GYB31_19925 [Bacteroidetes bacterium]|nr:hypothetical protein [Bacteroidota bacterium]